MPIGNETSGDRSGARCIASSPTLNVATTKSAYLKNASSGAVGKASAEQIRWLRQQAPERIRIKASGGIKTAQHVRELLNAGADLVGTSAGAQIMLEIQGDTPAGIDHAPDY